MLKFIHTLSLLFLTTCISAQEVDTLTLNHPEYQSKLPIGKVVPEIEAPDTLGNIHRLSDYRGKYVVLDFWATWCGDCRREIPFLKKLYDDYKDVKANNIPIEWLSFSFDVKAEAWKNIIRKENFPWLQISMLKSTREDSTFNDYKLRWIPAFLIIDPEGKLVSTSITADGLRKNLQTLTNIISEDNNMHPMTGAYSKQRNVESEDIELFNKTYKGEIALTPKKVSTQVVAGMNYNFTCEDKNGDLWQVKIFVPLPGHGEPEVTSAQKM